MTRELGKDVPIRLAPPGHHGRWRIVPNFPILLEALCRKHGVEAILDGCVVRHLVQRNWEWGKSGVAELLHRGDLVGPVVKVVEMTPLQHQDLLVFVTDTIVLKNLPTPLGELLLAGQLR